MNSVAMAAIRTDFNDMLFILVIDSGCTIRDERFHLQGSRSLQTDFAKICSPPSSSRSGDGFSLHQGSLIKQLSVIVNLFVVCSVRRETIKLAIR